MIPPRSADGDLDRAWADLLRAGASAPAQREVLDSCGADRPLLIALLRRAVPLSFLELTAATPPWSEDHRLLAAVVLSPRATRPLGLRLVGSLLWRDLADVAASPRVASAVRIRAEGLLGDQLPDLRLGEKITLAKIATPPVLMPLLVDPDAKVVEAGLINGRLREEDLLALVRADEPSRPLLEGIVASSRWRDRYALRLTIALQPKAPLALALGQLSALLPRDLRRVAATSALSPLVQAAAARLAEER
ncbi:MAG: hypothetical protein DMF78_02995 [Acidobacteria bacterium]|nr:MAG: hypothetical protein DMF78_02995 [Acidobacteriota bacterium]